MSIPRPICLNCHIEMDCTKNGIQVKDREVNDFPATIWSGDEFTCPRCNTKVVTNFGAGRIDDGSESIEFAQKEM